MNYNYYNILRIVIGITIAIFIFYNTADAALDCSQCHIGGPAVVAKDTIEVNDKTCFKCHNPEHPPDLIGYNTHLAHIGKYSAKVDYLNRHPKVTDSLNCNSCHVNAVNNCRNCHVKDIPHIQGDIGKNCRGCHGEADKLFRHPSIDVKIHDVFNLGSDNKSTCTMCHNSGDMKMLKLANGLVVSMQESYRLCYQCHSGYYRLWEVGSHYSGKAIPKDDSFKIRQIKDAWEANWRRENTCPNCHNPHNPNELYQLPRLQEAQEVTDISSTILDSTIIYVIVAIISIIIVFLVLKNRDRLKRSVSRLSKISMPKIPISISVEKYDDLNKKDVGEGTEKKVETEIKTEEEVLIKKVETEIKTEEEVLIKKEEKLIDEEEVLIKKEEKLKKTDTRPKRRFLHKRKGDILFISGIGIIFLIFYLIFGTFMPIAVVISDSMSPHIERGDMVFFTYIDRVNEIKTYNNSGGYESFGNYGNVILYKPDGGNTMSIVHRAMYYVEQGDIMWEGGPTAPYAGYITKGDNIVTNIKYDQQMSTSYQKPIKDEWIIGVANFRIPYIGYIRLMLPI